MVIFFNLFYIINFYLIKTMKNLKIKHQINVNIVQILFKIVHRAILMHN